MKTTTQTVKVVDHELRLYGVIKVLIEGSWDVCKQYIRDKCGPVPEAQVDLIHPDGRLAPW